MLFLLYDNGSQIRCCRKLRESWFASKFCVLQGKLTLCGNCAKDQHATQRFLSHFCRVDLCGFGENLSWRLEHFV